MKFNKQLMNFLKTPNPFEENKNIILKQILGQKKSKKHYQIPKYQKPKINFLKSKTVDDRNTSDLNISNC